MHPIHHPDSDRSAIELELALEEALLPQTAKTTEELVAKTALQSQEALQEAAA